MARYFITGASGYIGGSVAAALVRNGHEVRGLVRNEETATWLKERDITPIIGSLEDRALLVDEARRSDGAVNTASSDNHAAVVALIDGLAGSGKPLIHTSGSSVIGDDARGNYKSDKVFDEVATSLVHPQKLARHQIDRDVLSAAKRGVRSAVICPSLIYGLGRGIKQSSVQIPFLVQEACKRGRVPFVGLGASVWSNVHIDDVIDLFVRALVSAPAGAFYFAENGEASFLELAQALATRLRLPGTESLSVEEAAKLWGEPMARFSLGSNSRVSSGRARRELDWAPQHASAVEWIMTEMPA